MIITQPDRVLLLEQIARYAPKLHGTLLDLGSGRHRRYASLCPNVKVYKTMDHDDTGKPDIVGSAEAIPLEDGSVDCVLCTQVLEHVPHPHIVMREAFRIMRSGGYCLLTIPQMNELHEEPHDYFRYTSHGLRTLFQDAGFTVETINQRGKYHATLMQMRIRHMVDTWKPYTNRAAMLALCPLTAFLTRWALWRDAMDKNPASALHAIGWCILAKKP